MKHLKKFNESVDGKPSIEDIEKNGEEINDFPTQNYDEEHGVVTIYNYEGVEYRIVTWDHGGKEFIDGVVSMGGSRGKEEPTNTSKTRVLYVGAGNGDYSMMLFEEKYDGTPVIDIINDIEYYKSTKEDEGSWELKTFEYDQVDPKFVEFVRDRIQDYDDSKHHGFYLQNETVKR